MDHRRILARTASSALVVALAALAVLAAAGPARADGCRDATGELAPCPAFAPEAPVVEAPSDEGAREHPSEESGYVDVTWFADMVDPSTAGFAPDSPATVPDVVRGTHLAGVGSDFDHVFGGLTIGGGFRPVPWMRLPDLRFSFGYADFGGESVALAGGPQALVGQMRDVWNVRLQIGAGFDLDLDGIRLFALGHFSIGGYFASVDVGGSTIGGLGRDTFSALSLEAGWTAGMELEITNELAYTIGYRHTHTGLEQNTVFFGLDVALR